MADAFKALWARALGCDVEDVADDSNFFEEGGDSVMAIRLTGYAREEGMHIDAQTIFETPSFAALLERVEQDTHDESSRCDASGAADAHSKPPPLAEEQLMKGFKFVASCLRQCDGVHSSQLIDLMPCSPFQAELMEASHNFGVWIFQTVYEVEAGGDVELAKRAFEIIRDQNPIFRTRIAQHDKKLYQLVFSDPLVWEEHHEPLVSYKARDKERRTHYGAPLCRYAVVHDGGRTFIVWTKAHAVWDRWSKLHIMDDLRRCIADPDAFASAPARPPFRDFVDAVEHLDAAEGTKHWEDMLAGLKRYDLLVPGAPHRNFLSRPEGSMVRTMPMLRPERSQITFSTMTHVAWALCLANHSRENDIFFASFRSCRQMSIPHVEAVVGPCWSPVPVRMRLSPEVSLHDLLAAVQKDILAGTAYEPFGLQAMQKRFGSNAYLQSVILPQPAQPAGPQPVMTGTGVDGRETRVRSVDGEWSQPASHYGMYTMLTPKGDNLELWTRFDDSFIEGERVSALLDDFVAMLEKILPGSGWETTKVQDLCPELVAESEGPEGGSASATQDESLTNGHSYQPRTDSTTLSQILHGQSPRELAIVVPGRDKDKELYVSRADLKDHVVSFQKELASLGISNGSAVSMVLGNTYELVVAFLATTWQRGVAAPLNPGYKQEEFEFYIDDLASAVVLVPRGDYAKDAPAVRAARKFRAAIGEVYWNGSKIALDIKEKGQLEGCEPQELGQAQEDDVALVLHTSGTTGRPKAVPLSHANLMASAKNITRTYELSDSDRTMLIMPLFHIHGLVASFLSPLYAGGRIVLPSRLTPAFWQQFVAHGATWYSATPTMHRLILNFPPPSPVPDIRFIRSSSSQLAPVLLKQLEKKFGCPVLESYAMTEASHMMCSNPLPPAEHYPGSVGRPQGIELRILDDDGNEVPAGTVGEISIRGPNVTKGYINNPKANETSFTKDGYFRTGDQGVVSAEGYLSLTGRLKELINKGGEKISPVELDNVVGQHEAVGECVAFAIDDEDYGQNVGCAVKRKEGRELEARELKKWIAGRVAAFKVPVKIWFPEEIPKTATGKVQRKAVAEAMTKS